MKFTTPLFKALVRMDVQLFLDKSVDASTTTEELVAQETAKAIPLD